MGRLIYGLTASLDGFVNDPDGDLSWGEPDEETSRFVNDQQRGIGTYLFGRRMFETMRVWDDESALVGWPDYILDYVAVWRAADKVVYSTTLPEPSEPRTRLERRLDLDAVRALKESSSADLAVGGPTLARHFLAAGLVDELALFVAPVAIGGGTRFLPDGLHLDLTLLEERRFAAGTTFLRYAVRS